MGWWKVHLQSVKEAFKGALFTQWSDIADKDYAAANGITAVQGRDAPGLGRDMLHFNNNSGAQAINLAYLIGATRIILLGYDMQSTGGKSHFFGDHPPELSTANHAVNVPYFTRLAQDLEREGVEVINCSRDTALTQFKRAELEGIYA